MIYVFFPQGFDHFAFNSNIMPLEPVTTLSDDERVKTPPKKDVPKPKPKPRAKGSLKHPAAAAPIPAPETPKKRPAAKAAPSKSPNKKPAIHEKKVSVCKYKYKATGIYGITIDRKEKLRATCLLSVLMEHCHIVMLHQKLNGALPTDPWESCRAFTYLEIPWVCQCFGLYLMSLHMFFSPNHCVFLTLELKPRDGLSDEKMDEIMVLWLHIPAMISCVPSMQCHGICDHPTCFHFV